MNILRREPVLSRRGQSHQRVRVRFVDPMPEEPNSGWVYSCLNTARATKARLHDTLYGHDRPYTNLQASHRKTASSSPQAPLAEALLARAVPSTCRIRCNNQASRSRRRRSVRSWQDPEMHSAFANTTCTYAPSFSAMCDVYHNPISIACAPDPCAGQEADIIDEYVNNGCSTS